MTDYTERFRTLSIQQLQQVCALLCELVITDTRFERRLAAILAPDNRSESAHPISREANRQLHSTGETATVSDNSDKRPPHEVAFANLSPVPIAELVRGIGPAYWHERGFEQGREFERASAREDRAVAIDSKRPINERKIIRSGDLEVGKRYRIVEIGPGEKRFDGARFGEMFTCIGFKETTPKGTALAQRYPKGWFVYGDSGTYVTAVELVEDELEKSLRHVALEGETNGLRMGDSTTQEISVSAAHGLEREGNAPVPGGTPELHSEGDQGKSRNRSEVRAGDLHVHRSAEASTGMACEPSRHASDGLGASDGVDPTIIRAAEGVTLGPGEYVDAADASHKLRTPTLMTVESVSDLGRWVFRFGTVRRDWVTAVRRVGPKPAIEPVAPAAGVYKPIVKP